MSSKDEFILPFEGLKRGKHTFDLTITDTFFEEYKTSIIHGAEAKVQFILDKKETMMVGNFTVDGTVKLPCDRCMELMELPLKLEHQIIFKFGSEPSDDEDFIIVPENLHSIDISQPLYELMTVALPQRHIHKEGECDEKMLEVLENHQYNSTNNNEDEETKIDPRWNKLKNLK